VSKKLLEMSFDQNGNLLMFSYSYGSAKTEPGNDFSEVMTYDHMYHSSKPRVWFTSSQGRKYCMFIDEFDEVIKANKFVDNKITGTFRFEKRGQAQAIKLVLEKPKSP
jgi:hypothetical protein